jgi:hypothetical protein
MKPKHDRTRERLLRKIRQLDLADRAFCLVLDGLPYDGQERKDLANVVKGYRWAVNRVKELA